MTFEEYVRNELPRLLRFAGVLSGDRHLAEDIVQEVLFRTSRRWAQVSVATSTDAYVRRMVVNEYLSWRRKWARITPHADVDPGGLAPDHADAVAARDEAASRLNGLSPRQRTVLILRYYEGLSDEQIAHVLGCAGGTVRSLASRALAELRVEAAEPDLLDTRKDG